MKEGCSDTFSIVDFLWPDTEEILPDSSVERFQRRAREEDQTGRLSDESFNELHRLGYFGLPVPSDFKGLGASLLTCCAIQRKLGSANPSLAIALNMHLFSVGVMVEHWRRKRDASWLLLEAIATQSRLVASAFAEPGLGGNLLRSRCLATRVSGGYLVSGIKGPCSLAARCDLICLQFESIEEVPQLCVALVPSNAQGIRIEKRWNSLGMRASESDQVRFEKCFIPDKLIFHRSPPGIEDGEVFSAGLLWFCLTTTAAYLGLVRGATMEASAILKDRRASSQ